MNMKHAQSTLKTFTPLLVVFTILLAGNFINAGWNPPRGNPSVQNNAPAPINVSKVNQIKIGDITARNLKAGNQMWAPAYCDEAGQNCFAASTTPVLPRCAAGETLQAQTDGSWACSSSAGSGVSVQYTITDCSGNGSCPAGYTQVERTWNSSCGPAGDTYKLTCIK